MTRGAVPTRCPTTDTDSSGVGPVGITAATLMIAVLAVLSRPDPAAPQEPPAVAPALTAATAAGPGDAAPREADFTPLSADRVVPPTPTVPAPGEVIVVADPVPGDLRIDEAADTLPIEYVPPAPASSMVDIAYGPLPIQRLDLHLPSSSAAPVLLYLHGGGWIAGEKSDVPDLVMRFVERGYAVASADYRLAPDHPFPEPIEDVKLAIRWVKAYAEDEGTVDGDRIVLVGASAGGHLAAFAAATPGDFEPVDLPTELAAFDSTVAGAVSFVGPTDLVQLYDQPHDWARAITSAFMGCSPCDPGQLAVGSVAPHLGPGLPPVYWAYGADDPLVDATAQAAAVAEAWAIHGGDGSSWLDIVEGSGHTLDESVVNQRALEAFVDAAVGRPQVDASDSAAASQVS